MDNQAAEKALEMNPDCSVIEILRQRRTSTVCEGPRHLAVWTSFSSSGFSEEGLQTSTDRLHRMVGTVHRLTVDN